MEFFGFGASDGSAAKAVGTARLCESSDPARVSREARVVMRSPFEPEQSALSWMPLPSSV